MTTLTLDFRLPFIGRLFTGAGKFVLDGNKIPLDQARQIVASKRCLMLISGYNSSETSALDSYKTVLSGINRQCGDIDSLYDVVIQVLWPTSTKPGYWLAEGKIYFDGLPGKWDDGIGSKLRDVLKSLSYASLDVVSHSLGNGVILDALRGADARNVRNLFLTNPAVDNNSICIGHAFAKGVAAITGKCLVFYSKHDDVLKLAFRGAHLMIHEALGYTGPAGGEIGPNVIPVDATSYCFGHSDARNHVEYFMAIVGTVKPFAAAA